MAYPTDHILMTFGGPLYGGGEQWTNSLRLLGVGAEGDGEQAADQAACEAYAEIIRTWWIDATTKVSSAASLGWVKYNRVSTEGLYKHQYTNLKDFNPDVAPVGGLYQVPPQVALVVTLRTPIKRGLAHAGRVFLPVPSVVLDTDGRLSTSARDGYVTSYKTLLDNINAEDTAQYVGVTSKVRTGAQQRVTRVEVGRVYDTMRSRRTNLSEEHAGQNLATP